jgi:hypothetical protein
VAAAGEWKIIGRTLEAAKNCFIISRGVTWVSAFGGCQQYLHNKIKFCPTKRGVDSSSTQAFANVYYEYALLL